MALTELERIAPLVNKSRDLAFSIVTLEQELKKKKQEQRRMLETEIPELMNELEISCITMKDGAQVDVVPFVDARIPVAKQASAFGWLRENGYGDLIKHVITSQFAAGEEDEAKAVCLYLEENGFSAADKVSVHPGTLKAWAKERDAEGDEVPEDLFGIYRGSTTKIREPKK